jgi:hypothetical protein
MVRPMSKKPQYRDLELTFSGGSIGYDATLALVKSVRDYATSLDIQIHTQSRISQFEQQLNRFGSARINELNKSNFDWNSFTEGNRDVTEIAFICEKLINLFPSELTAVLKPLFDGAILPSSDANTLARNRQFELYMAALFAHSGFSIELKEPDLKFEHQGTYYGIAAKRISSAKQIKKRVQEARSQLSRAGLRGLIALSVDRLLAPEIPRVVASSETALDLAGESLVNKILTDYGPTIAPLLCHPNVIGLVVNLVVPAMMAGTAGHIGTTTSLRLMPRPDDEGTIALTQSINSRIKGPY